MNDRRYHLAQVNIAHLREPLDAPLLADFVAALAPLNALADAAPGFVWRLQTESGDATEVRAFDDDQIIVNLSTWDSLEALADYVFRSEHTPVMRRRRSWFHKMDGHYLALWWVPAGHRPTVAEAQDRLRHLEANGPSTDAFTFQAPFPSPGATSAPVANAADLCTA